MNSYARKSHGSVSPGTRTACRALSHLGVREQDEEAQEEKQQEEQQEQAGEEEQQEEGEQEEQGEKHGEEEEWKEPYRTWVYESHSTSCRQMMSGCRLVDER